MGTTEWVGINQPILNGMAGTSEREIWSKGHALCCETRQKSNLLLSFHAQRSSGMNLMALLARWAGVSRSRAREDAGCKTLLEPSYIFPLVPRKTEMFSQYWQGKKNGIGWLGAAQGAVRWMPRGPGVMVCGGPSRSPAWPHGAAVLGDPMHPQPTLATHMHSLWWSSHTAAWKQIPNCSAGTEKNKIGLQQGTKPMFNPD